MWLSASALCWIVGLLHYVEAEKMDVLKISDVPFPSSPWKQSAATINASYHQDIAEFTLCYRFSIESFNNGLFFVFAAPKDKDFGSFYILHRMGFDWPGADGYQGGLNFIGREIPGGGLGSRAFPVYQSYVLARNIDISKARAFKLLNFEQMFLIGRKFRQFYLLMTSVAVTNETYLFSIKV